MVDADDTSVPVIAVTAAVGAVVLLFTLLCHLGRRQSDISSENSGCSGVGEGLGSFPRPSCPTD